MTLITVLVISFLVVAFFCASEIAFSTANRVKIRMKAKSGGYREKKVLKLTGDPDSFLIPTLVGTNIANVAYVSSLAYILIEFDIVSVSHLELTLYESVTLVIFAEVIPKVLAKKSAERAVYLFIIPFILFSYILLPVNIFVGWMSRNIMKFMNIPLDQDDWLLVTKSDIDSIVDEAVKTRTVKKDDAKIISKVMNLGETRVKEIMLHRKSIIGVDIQSTVFQLKRLIYLTSLSKIIVYENDLDDIKGTVFANDLIKDVKNISDIIRPVLFIPETTSVLSLFKTFKKERSSIAVIIDEFGGSVGLITMHDILESIVGKVDDQGDNELSNRGIIYRSSRNCLIVNGDADTEELESMIGSIIKSEAPSFSDRYETVNGYLINYLQRIPREGEIFEIDGLKYRIAKAKKNYIENIIIQLPKKISEK